MESLTFGDLVVIVLLAFGLLATIGVYGRWFASTALWWGFAVRILAVALRAAGVGFFAREEDAANFALGSRSLAEQGAGIYREGGAARYQQLLALYRRHLGLSVFGLEAVGMIVWLIGSWLILDSLRVMTNARLANRAMWLVALLPSGLLFTTGILREPYEFTIVALAIRVFVHTQRSYPASVRGRGPLLAAGATLLLGGLLHAAFIVAALVIVLGHELIRVITNSAGRIRAHALAGLLVLLMLFGAPIARFGTEREAAALFAGAASYRGAPAELGPLTGAADVVVGYVLYVVSPLPWQVRGPADVVAFLEVAMRVFLMIAAIRKRHSPEMLGILLALMAVQFGFSVGTVNWGTALRHNYVSLPPLAILFALHLSSKERENQPATVRTR